MLRLILVPVVLAAALVAAGCGGGAAAEPAARAPVGVVPAAATGVATLAVERLDGAPALRDALAEKLAEEDFRLDDLGDEVVLVAVEHDVVALTRLDDPPAGAAARELDGWTAVAGSDAVLDRYEAALAAGTIDGDADYEAAAETWPDDALLTAFARGDALREAMHGSALSVSAEADWLAAAAVVEDGSLRVTGLARGGAGAAGPIPAGLLERVPVDATAVVAAGPKGAVDRASLPEPLRPLLALAERGSVVALGPGLLELTAIFAADDPEAALREAAQALGGEPAGDGYRFALGELRITAEAVDGAVVAGTAAGRETGRPRAIDDVPGDATGVLYADVPRVLPLLGLLGPPAARPEIAEAPLGTVVAWTTREGEDARLELVADLR